MDTPEEKFEMWARVDLFGHNTRVGKLSVVNNGVEVLYRLDIPTSDSEFVTKFYGKGAVYSIDPMSEEAARAIASRAGVAPIFVYDLPDEWRKAINAVKQLPASVNPDAVSDARVEDGFDDDEEDDDDEEESPF